MDDQDSVTPDHRSVWILRKHIYTAHMIKLLTVQGSNAKSSKIVRYGYNKVRGFN